MSLINYLFNTFRLEHLVKMKVFKIQCNNDLNQKNYQVTKFDSGNLIEPKPMRLERSDPSEEKRLHEMDDEERSRYLKFLENEENNATSEVKN